MRLQPVAQQFTRRWIQSLHTWPLLSSSPAPLPLKLTPIHPPGLEGALCTPRGSFIHFRFRLSTACPVLRLPCLSLLFCKLLQAKVIRSVLVVVSWAWKTGEMVTRNDHKWVPHFLSGSVVAVLSQATGKVLWALVSVPRCDSIYFCSDEYFLGGVSKSSCQVGLDPEWVLEFCG